jgi:outer membrane protein OmpA-like peptidoglycan-associated protein
MSSTRVNGLWTKPQKLSFIQDGINYVHPVFIENDSVLVFSAKLKDSDHYDLFYTEMEGGQWLEPEKFPASINTNYNESFPTSEVDTLYFSSDAPTGMGGMDIYKTYLEKGSWKKPERLLFPLNSGGDDFAFINEIYLPRSRNILKQGYLSSSRSNDGKDFIYRYYITKQTIKEDIPTADQKERDFDLYLALKVMRGKDFNTSKGSSVLTNTKVTIISNNKVVVQGNTDRNGLLLTQLDKNAEYEIVASKDSFFNNRLYFNTREIKSPDGNTVTINKEIYLSKIEKGKEIVLDNIYYDYDKWDIKSEAIPTLNKLTELLMLNPQINIDLGSHTDCRGKEDYNKELSQKRAQSVIDFLISKGINKERLIATGYGESKPSVTCQCENCSEEEHQKNRRTSFKIL